MPPDLAPPIAASLAPPLRAVTAWAGFTLPSAPIAASHTSGSGWERSVHARTKESPTVATSMSITLVGDVATGVSGPLLRASPSSVSHEMLLPFGRRVSLAGVGGEGTGDTSDGVGSGETSARPAPAGVETICHAVTLRATRLGTPRGFPFGSRATARMFALLERVSSAQTQSSPRAVGTNSTQTMSSVLR